MKIFQLFFLATFFIVACSSSDDAKDPSTAALQDCDRVYIYINRETGIAVDPQKDSVFLFRQRYDTAAPTDMHTWQTIKRLHAPVLSDSLVVLAYELIAKPLRAESHVTCYGGDYFNVTITKGSAKYSASFESVVDWTTETEQTLALYHYLKRNGLLDGK